VLSKAVFYLKLNVNNTLFVIIDTTVAVATFHATGNVIIPKINYPYTVANIYVDIMWKVVKWRYKPFIC
jgi:hypothetical protein